MTSLTERYVAATNDGFPAGDQAEVEHEVRAALNDIVEACMDQGMSQEEAERAAVEELGDPGVFAEQFRKEPRHLIGPRVFSSWWFVLKSMLLVVVPIVIGISLFAALSDANASYAEVLVEALASGFSVGIQVAFWVTVTFTILEYYGVHANIRNALVSDDSWSIQDLPDINNERQIGPTDLVYELVTLSLFVYFITQVATEKMGALGLHQWLDLSENIPVFNPALSPLWYWGIIGIVAVTGLVALWKFAMGFWTQTVTLVNVLINVAWIGFFIAISAADDIINPEILELKPELGSWSIVGENSTNIIVTIFLAICLWDIWESVKGHMAFRRQSRMNHRQS